MAGECILCGKCLSVCPLIKATNREELGPRAKSDLCRLLKEQPDLLASKDVKQLAGLCIGCHRCKAVCSQGMNVPGLVSELRGAHPDLKSWLWKTWLTNANKWGLGSSAAKLVPEALVPEQFGQQLKMLAGLKGGPGLTPCLEPKTFPDTYRGEKILLFAGCTATHVQGRWLMVALRLLDGLGADVLPADFQCCGSGLKAAGFHDDSRKMAKHNVTIWKAAGKPHVIGFCASCLAGLKGYDCFRNEEERDEWLAALSPLSELLDGVEFNVDEAAADSIAYHRPCHGSDADGAFLGNALGEHLVASTSDECCGFGGLLRLAAPELTEGVNAACWDVLNVAGTVVTGCSACSGQLANTAPEGASVGHWLELIG